ncbi:unnamed protein product [Durusdinium trenchii]|uniref:Uncharacterized protein n=1 Tax=Durusdinium trenchii TaxID=1381693 RepID=A0ABP0PEP4_9DINO
MDLEGVRRPRRPGLGLVVSGLLLYFPQYAGDACQNCTRGTSIELILPQATTEERLFLLGAGEHVLLIIMYACFTPASMGKERGSDQTLVGEVVLKVLAMVERMFDAVSGGRGGPCYAHHWQFPDVSPSQLPCQHGLLPRF